MVAQQIGKPLLCKAEKPLVLPKCIIGIKADCGQILHHFTVDPGTASFLMGHWGYIETPKPALTMTDKPK
jgi:hypothetical protein